MPDIGCSIHDETNAESELRIAELRGIPRGTLHTLRRAPIKVSTGIRQPLLTKIPI
jgi:hypothetical protein